MVRGSRILQYNLLNSSSFLSNTSLPVDLNWCCGVSGEHSVGVDDVLMILLDGTLGEFTNRRY
jgi:hypothetical protein